MKSPFKRKPAGSTDIEAELARLQQKLADNERKRSDARQALAAARSARRDVLGDDDTIIDRATAAVRKAQLEADDMDKLVDEYRSAISDAEERLTKAQHADKVEAAASKLEAVADQMDGQAAAIEKAAAAVAASVKAMMAIMPPGMAIFPTFSMHRPGERPEQFADYASPREAASIIIAEALLHAVPEIFDRYYSGQDPRAGGAPSGYRASLSRIMNPAAPQPDYAGDTADFKGLPPAAAISALVSDRARENARKIRAGEILPDISTLQPTRIEPALRLVTEEQEEVRRALG